VDWRMVATALI
jgi:hypothetical protein